VFPRALGGCQGRFGPLRNGFPLVLTAISCIENKLLGPRSFYAAAAFSPKGRLGSFRSITLMTCVAVQATSARCRNAALVEARCDSP
jgi:hypothetical protein